MDEFSFERGFGQVQQKDLEVVKNRLMSALKINNRVSWAKRKSGAIEPKKSEAEAIEAIFAEYGITDVWGKLP